MHSHSQGLNLDRREMNILQQKLILHLSVQFRYRNSFLPLKFRVKSEHSSPSIFSIALQKVMISAINLLTVKYLKTDFPSCMKDSWVKENHISRF